MSHPVSPDWIPLLAGFCLEKLQLFLSGSSSLGLTTPHQRLLFMFQPPACLLEGGSAAPLPFGAPRRAWSFRSVEWAE